MRLKVVPASRGLAWVRSGIRLCVKQPLGFVSLLGLFVTAAMAMMLLPVLGPLLVVAAMPAVWMAFMLASRRVLLDQRITPGVMIEALNDVAMRREWLRLGALYTAATVVVMVLGSLLGPGIDDLAQAIEAAEQGQSVLDDPVVQRSVLWRLGLTLPVSLVFWHTPALLHWARVPAFKALFFSAVASWRNLGAFAVYSACWVGVLVALGLALQLLGVLVPEPTLLSMLAVAAGVWVVSAFYASLYFSVVECFEQPGSEAPEADGNPPSRPAEHHNEDHTESQGESPGVGPTDKPDARAQD